jgi:hypothetical protein
MTAPLEVILTNGEFVRILTSPTPIGWAAFTDNYDLGSPQGLGRTRGEAMADLVDQLEDRLAPPLPVVARAS